MLYYNGSPIFSNLQSTYKGLVDSDISNNNNTMINDNNNEKMIDTWDTTELAKKCRPVDVVRTLSLGEMTDDELKLVTIEGIKVNFDPEYLRSIGCKYPTPWEAYDNPQNDRSQTKELTKTNFSSADRMRKRALDKLFKPRSNTGLDYRYTHKSEVVRFR